MVRWGGRWRGKEDGVSSNLSICILITTCPAYQSLCAPATVKLISTVSAKLPIRDHPHLSCTQILGGWGSVSRGVTLHLAFQH